MATSEAYRPTLVWSNDSLVWSQRTLQWDPALGQPTRFGEMLDVQRDKTRLVVVSRGDPQAVNVIPSRFSDKTEKESKLYTINWTNALDAGDAIVSANWISEPSGLAFSNPTISGLYTQVTIGGGVRGQTYRIRLLVTTTRGEELEITNNANPGVEIQITGHGLRGSDYSWAGYRAYG